MGRFFEEPGRSILKDGFRAIVPPAEEWEGVKRLVLELEDSPTYGLERAAEEALWLRKRLTLGEYGVYLRTMSAVSNWKAGLRIRG